MKSRLPNSEWFQPETLSERARAWAATMDGFSAGGETAVRFAHDGPVPSPQNARDREPREGFPSLRFQPLLRAEKEAQEQAALSPGATLSGGAGDRVLPEEPDPVRTCFERDRDRIVHGTAFRRLAGKTQVFIFPSDHQRTRLTHALEVAQVARSIAQACRLNVALAEAIALGHDCGHGPGGHASEDALSPFVQGGYDHAVWGADVVLAPLNLCKETLDGVRNHSWSRPSPQTLEGEVVSWADRIAYVCHDFEDAVLAGLVYPKDLPRIVTEVCGSSRSSQLNAFIVGVVEAFARTGRVAMVEQKAEALAAFRNWNYERIYLRPASQEQGRAVVSMLRALVEHFADRPTHLPEAWVVGATPLASSDAALRAAVTYVAGMTDRFACNLAVSELHWEPSRLPSGVP